MDTSKQCSKCEQFFPATPEFFSRNKNRKDGLQTLCKLCMKAYKQQHYQTHKAEISEKHKAYAVTHKEHIAAHKKQYAEDHKEHIQAYYQQYYQDRKEQWSEKGKLYYQEHREQKVAYQRRYNELQREQISQRRKVRRQANREQIAAKRKQHYHTHKEQMQQQSKRYYATHKQQHYAYDKQYRKTERGKLIRRALWHKREAQKKALEGSYTAQDIQLQYKRQKGMCYWCHKKLYEYHIDHVTPLARGGSNHPSNIVVACPTCNMRRQARLPHEWPDGGRLL